WSVRAPTSASASDRAQAIPFANSWRMRPLRPRALRHSDARWRAIFVRATSAKKLAEGNGPREDRRSDRLLPLELTEDDRLEASLGREWGAVMASELQNFFDSFYDRFVLRDLFGKIVPGGSR